MEITQAYLNDDLQQINKLVPTGGDGEVQREIARQLTIANMLKLREVELLDKLTNTQISLCSIADSLRSLDQQGITVISA